jgi:hypothetical protein
MKGFRLFLLKNKVSYGLIIALIIPNSGKLFRFEITTKSLML